MSKRNNTLFFPKCYYFVYRGVLIHSARILKAPRGYWKTPFVTTGGPEKPVQRVTTGTHRVIHKVDRWGVCMLMDTSGATAYIYAKTTSKNNFKKVKIIVDT